MSLSCIWIQNKRPLMYLTILLLKWPRKSFAAEFVSWEDKSRENNFQFYGWSAVLRGLLSYFLANKNIQLLTTFLLQGISEFSTPVPAEERARDVINNHLHNSAGTNIISDAGWGSPPDRTGAGGPRTESRPPPFWLQRETSSATGQLRDWYPLP